MKKIILLIVVLIANNQLFAQNSLDLGEPTNRWSVRASTNGNQEFYIVPMGSSWWDWSKATIFKPDGTIHIRKDLFVSGNLNGKGLTGTSGEKLSIQGYNWQGIQKGLLLKAPEEGIDFQTFDTNWKSRMFIRDNGNIGVGTVTPSSKLHIHNGALRLTGDNSNGGPMILFGENGQTTDNGQWGIEYVPSKNGTPGLNFWRPWPNSNFGNHFLFLSDTGKVAVGTDKTPTSIGGADISSYRFFVKGGMLAEEIRVRTGWADYVFADDYILKPLSEVEAFIKKNKHLPNVPSANTVENQGIELGNISKIQQEKIEELTLYLIEQQKQIDELKSLIYELKNKNLENGKN